MLLPASTAILTDWVSTLGHAEWSMAAMFTSESFEAITVKGPNEKEWFDVSVLVIDLYHC